MIRSRIIAITAHGSKAPERAVLRALADAAATAHLVRTSDAALADADTAARAMYGQSLDAQAAGYATVSPSKVMPDGVEHVHAYSTADYITVQELRVELEIIKEIDTRTALRDQPGTNGGADIAKGETQRRAPHVARARELMATLQLGSTDHAYLEARLAELSAVFPGIEKIVVPAIEMRIQSRERTADFHRQAEAFRAARQAEIETITRLVASGTFSTDRVVVGAGPSALADVATLGVGKSGKVIDPTKLLVVGGADLMDRIDPSFLWGQRGAVYDRSTNAHPAFSDAEGVGTGELIDAIEDPGEFMHVGEMRDAMDRTRERIGMVAVDAQVLTVETLEQQRTQTPWANRVVEGVGISTRDANQGAKP
ncbi:MAG: hypothetical protein ABI591_14270 [Kofleriaceae bacterium]